MSRADSKSPSMQEQQNMQTVPFPQQFEDDSIDLYQLLITLWEKKLIVITVTFIAALGSIIFALQQQKIYMAKTFLLPPKAKHFQSLNMLGIQKFLRDKELKIRNQFTSNEIFSVFKKNLKSRTIHKKFIQEHGLMEILAPKRNPETRHELIHQVFSSMINIQEENGITSLSMEHYDPEIATRWVNELAKFVDRETISMLVEDSLNTIENTIREIEYSISSKRIMAEKRREDQITRYSEHAQIAKKLGIIGRVDATNIIQNTQMNVEIATASTPLYYLGYEALTTEINILRTRKSDDPFILGLRDYQEQLELLRTIKFDKESMHTVLIDQKAFPPENAIRPNRRLIVYIGTLVGLFTGVFIAFFFDFVQKQRKKHS